VISSGRWWSPRNHQALNYIAGEGRSLAVHWLYSTRRVCHLRDLRSARGLPPLRRGLQPPAPQVNVVLQRELAAVDMLPHRGDRVRIGHPPARAGKRRVSLLSALRTHTKAPSKSDLLWRTLRPLQRPKRTRTVCAAAQRAPPPSSRPPPPPTPLPPTPPPPPPPARQSSVETPIGRWPWSRPGRSAGRHRRR
jgi:hypothetical protein